MLLSYVLKDRSEKAKSLNLEVSSYTLLFCDTKRDRSEFVV
jgi:hypothetical protein